MKFLKQVLALFSSFTGWSKRLLVVALFSADEPTIRREFDNVFNEAKRVSDFVGMIVRMAFIVFALGYFTNKLEAADTYIERVKYLPCWGLFIGLGIALGNRILAIVFLHLASDMAFNPSKVGKFLVLITATWLSCLAFLGIYDLASDIAAASQVASR